MNTKEVKIKAIVRQDPSECNPHLAHGLRKIFLDSYMVSLSNEFRDLESGQEFEIIVRRKQTNTE